LIESIQHLFFQEKETILPVKEIINHPWFKPDNLREGYDIAVYIGTISNFENMIILWL
jgi:hypothetical protein